MSHGNQGYKKGCRCEICKRVASVNGARSYLRNRDKVRARQAAYRKANPEKEQARKDRWRAKDPDGTHARELEYWKAYRARNPEKARAASAAWRLANPDKAKAASDAWFKENPDRLRQNVELRRLRSLNAEICEVTEKDWRRLCARFRECCAYCGEQTILTRDHVIPLSRGGRHSIGNLLPACRRCNTSKLARFLMEWRQHPGRKTA